MTMLTDNQLIKITKQLVAIESTAQNPSELHSAYNVIVKMLLNCNKDITVEHFQKDGVPSLLAYLGKHRPDNFRIILNGHLDVVPAKSKKQFKPYIKDGSLYGRGVYDMKAASVIMAATFCEYVDKVPYALGLQIVTDEEVAGHNGTGYQISQGVRGDFVICGECGRLEGTHEIANEAKGIAWVDIEFTGTEAHGAYLWRGNNAVLQATEFVKKVTERYPVPAEETMETTINVASFKSGNEAGHTKVPDHASLRLEIRFTHQDPNFRTKQHLASFIEELDPNAQISGIPTFEQPVYTNPKNPLLLQLKAAAEKVEGHEFKLTKRHATSDGRFYANVGDQACEFGIAGQDQHGENESITIEAFKNYRKALDLFLKRSIKTEAANTNTKAYTSD